MRYILYVGAFIGGTFSMAGLSQTLIPLPPPPPPGAETTRAKDALAGLARCLYPPEGLTARNDALRATKNLRAAPGTRQWNDALDVVRIYVGQRQRQQRCLMEIEHLRQSDAVTEKDRVALEYSLKAYAEGWLREGLYEANVLRGLVGLPTHPTGDTLPPVTNP